MKIVRIIPETDALLSVYNEKEEISEFRLLFDNWYDVQYLHDFFVANKQDLGGISVEKAVERTLEDAESLEYLIEDTALNESDDLQIIFKSLSPGEYRLRTYQREKAYGTAKRSWLRVYAIRIHQDLYVITGGAIKLTRTMQERSHTNEQLKRLNKVRDYLKTFGFNENDIEDLEIEL
jgi:hypothetical protein